MTGSTKTGSAVEPPFTLPPAYVDWGALYREMVRALRSEDEFCDLCDAVEQVLCYSPLAPPRDAETGRRVVCCHVPNVGSITVGYDVDRDRAGYLRCSVRRIAVRGVALAA